MPESSKPRIILGKPITIRYVAPPSLAVGDHLIKVHKSRDLVSSLQELDAKSLTNVPGDVAVKEPALKSRGLAKQSGLSRPLAMKGKTIPGTERLHLLQDCQC